mmetsp:Transcript_82044/g.171737  ORF Transcript_82044/g.171737 Transcript_82044/m.171737 type:complete len:84 (+) Transcript_82044:638-889(+)
MNRRRKVQQIQGSIKVLADRHPGAERERESERQLREERRGGKFEETFEGKLGGLQSEGTNATKRNKHNMTDRSRPARKWLANK